MNEETRKEIITMLNKALELEHMARIQYLAHAENIEGINAEPIVARLKEIAQDEAEHQEKFRTMIGDYLDGEVAMDMSQTKKASDKEEILRMNLKDEKDAIDFYKKVHEKIKASRESLPYSFLGLEHEMRHVIMDEEEHIAELRTLLDMDLDDVEGGA